MQSLDAFSPTPGPLGTVLTMSELGRRAPRTADFQAENRALVRLAQMLGAARGSLLQTLSDVALELCDAHSAGVTLLETGGTQPVLRWRALSGRLAPHVGAAVPRVFSPCGTTIDADAIQLMSHPGRDFPYIQAWAPEIKEILITPLRAKGTPRGTVWVAAHDDARHFDAEDARRLTSLSSFAGAAYGVLTEVRALEAKLASGNKAANLISAATVNQDRFIAILAHELRNGLAPTKNAAQILKRESLDDATRLRMSGIVERQVTGMTRLIDELLDVARLRAGNIDVRRTRVSIADIIEHTVEGVRPLLAAREHKLVVHTPPQPVFVDVDVLWLSHALQNIVGNAAKYTNPRGEIWICAEQKGDEVAIRVSDNGIGIAPEALETIFEPYAQAGQAGTERSAGGLGLGLYLARLLIEGHGGVVKATSGGRGCGSEFVVLLPCRFGNTAAAKLASVHV